MAKKYILTAPPTHPDGTTIGETTADKAGFHGAAVVQRAGAAQVALPAATYAAPAAIAADIAGGEPPTEAEFNAALASLRDLRTQLVALAADVALARTLANELRAALVEKGTIKGAA
jgi:hypothetical protein